MTSSDQADGSGSDGGQPKWSSWQDAISRRLTRSATIALLLSPIGLVIISVTRLLIVSDYNTVTASAIVSSGGYVDALLGTIIPVVPFVLPYLVLVLLFFNRVILAVLAMLATALISPVAVGRAATENFADKDWHHILGAPVGIDVIMALLAFVTILLLAVVLVLRFENFARTVATIVCIVLIPFIAQVYAFPIGARYYTDLIRQPWLPAETITFTSGQSIIGYVLADDGATLTVLLDDNRAVSYYPDRIVAKRQVCEISQAGKTRPLIAILPAGTLPSRTPLCRPVPGRSAQAGRQPQARVAIPTERATSPVRFLPVAARG